MTRARRRIWELHPDHSSRRAAGLGFLVGTLAIALSACGSDGGGGGAENDAEAFPTDVPVVANPGAGRWDSASAWRLVEEWRIGSAEGAGPEVFASIADVAVDAYERAFVLDRRANEVRVFDAAGQHVRTFGRKGQGPGEFKDPIALALGPDGRLWVVDPGNGRFVVFDTAGRFLETHRRASSSYAMPWKGGFDTVGRLYDHSFVWQRGGPVRHVLVRYGADLGPVDTVWLPSYRPAVFEIVGENTRSAYSVPFSPRLAWTFDHQGYVWYGVTDRYRIYQRRLDGEIVRVIDKGFTPVPVTAGEREEAIAKLERFRRQGGKVDESRIPDTKPAFSDLWVDDHGYLWVAPTVPPGSPRALDVFDPDGVYLGRLAPVPVRRFLAVSGDLVYGVVADTLGVPYLVRLRIVGRAG
jgi:streptogramin lyase